MNRLTFIAFILGMIGVYSNAQAQDRVGIMPSSYHFDRDAYNETHGGVFYEHQLNEVNWIGVMHYTNSIDNPSLMLYGTNETYIGQNGVVDFGLMYGVVSGYDMPIIPFVIPTATINISENIDIRAMYFVVGVSASLIWEF